MPRIDYGALDGLPGAVKKGQRKQRPIIGERNNLPIRKRLAPRNEERHAYRHGITFGAQADACRKMPCAACGMVPRKGEQSDPHHEPPVSLGGLDPDTVPLCRACHDRRGNTTAEAFWLAVGLDPEDVKQAVRDWMGSPLYHHHDG